MRRTLFSGGAVSTVCCLLASFCPAMAKDGAPATEEPNVNQTYTVHRAVSVPELEGKWDGPAWKEADTFAVQHFHPQSSGHRPKVQGKMLFTDKGVYVIFKVEDRYVVSTYSTYQDPVCRDSCVEFFVQPKAKRGYFNFEINCGGTLLLQFHERNEKGEDVPIVVPQEEAQGIKIYHSMPEKVSPEIAEDVVWYVEYLVPFSVFECYIGPLGTIAGQAWRANFYKCADRSSHPHWAAWAPIGEKLSFHQPAFFGTIRFAK
jgi:hypothetical protein